LEEIAVAKRGRSIPGRMSNIPKCFAQKAPKKGLNL
jgi:hypothetical protein